MNKNVRVHVEDYVDQTIMCEPSLVLPPKTVFYFGQTCRYNFPWKINLIYCKPNENVSVNVTLVLTKQSYVNKVQFLPSFYFKTLLHFGQTYPHNYPWKIILIYRKGNENVRVKTGVDETIMYK